MEIKPMYDNTIKMNVTSIKLEAPTKMKADKDRTIPNGIYKVIRWERIRQWFTIGLNISIVTAAIILTILYATVLDVSWIAYSVPIILFLLSGWKLLTTLFERGRLNRSVERYKEDLRIGLDTTPPFIANLYMSLHTKQVAHNWLTMFTLFYGGIATLLLWWLKDVSWWIFDFKSWIEGMFSNPTTMAWLFTTLLLTVSVLHIVFAIQRNKRIQEINSYFGTAIASTSDIETMKQSKNKMYRRLFIISIMVVLVIPILVRFILKFTKRK